MIHFNYSLRDLVKRTLIGYLNFVTFKWKKCTIKQQSTDNLNIFIAQLVWITDFITKKTVLLELKESGKQLSGMLRLERRAVRDLNKNCPVKKKLSYNKLVKNRICYICYQ